MKNPLKQITELLKVPILIFLLVVAFFLYISFTISNNLVSTSTNSKKEKSWNPKSLKNDIPKGALEELIQYGHQVITQTSKVIGPMANDNTMMFAGNNLACSNCHLDAGRKIGAGSFVGVTNRFPQYRGRENKIGTIEERINGCMQRSMNGNAMPEESREMQAIVAYMEWLSESVPADVENLYKGFLSVKLPTIKADSSIGKVLYQKNCTLCHGENGKGQLNESSQFTGYKYPPLAGGDSFNDGAGMNRVITAAQFIKSNMPFGATYDQPLVSDEEAYHIASYITSFQRPSKPDKEKDFPDLKLKPVSTSYGSWADNFTIEQHKYGPFQPIQLYYKNQYGLIKTK